MIGTETCMVANCSYYPPIGTQSGLSNENGFLILRKYPSGYDWLPTYLSALQESEHAAIEGGNVRATKRANATPRFIWRSAH